MRKALILFGALAIFLAGCSNSGANLSEDNISGNSSGEIQVEYIKITAAEAKEIIDGDEAIVILDVRTADEYATGHISGAILLPFDEIPVKAEQLIPDKDVKILVYCRSGNRSKTASNSLIDMGYTKVYDFGGIIDWPYEIVY